VKKLRFVNVNIYLGTHLLFPALRERQMLERRYKGDPGAVTRPIVMALDRRTIALRARTPPITAI